ncbi:isochorismate synthase MenF [Gallibacterium trehalosifermentans]|uniref:Isochorismate synthase MenF n=1 Tax=Gallibacterium trehalosifermentans TaxID=516935 RepID=A0ABV6H1H8_9PAST
MNVLQQLKTLLTEQIAIYQPSSQPFGMIHLTLTTPKVDFIAWLKAQTLFPQFYFQQRHQQYEVVALGSLLQIKDFQQLTELKQQYPNFNFIGGVKFAGELHFLLPQFYLEYRKQQLTIKLFIDHLNWATQKQQLAQYWATFEQTQAIHSIQHITPTLIQQSSNQAEWQSLIQQALLAIQQKQFDKVVLAQKITFDLDNQLNAFDFLASSAVVNQHCYHFLFAETQQSAFLGSSPECLYQRTDDHIYSEALAGTAPIGDTKQQQLQYQNWLLNDHKNLEENQFVAEDIQQKMSPFCQHIKIEDVQLRILRKVQHLCRPIHTVLSSQYRYWEPLLTLHPTAAIAGYPKQTALDFIKRYEPFERDWYAGAIGIISQKFSELCVGLRSAQLNHDKLHLFAGAGIVKESVASEEWQEISKKMSGLLSLFNTHLDRGESNVSQYI